jgi:hypothetical protein
MDSCAGFTNVWFDWIAHPTTALPDVTAEGHLSLDSLRAME